MSIRLRDYQQQSVDEIRAAYSSGCHAPLLVSPTGSGKTVVFAYIAQGATAKGNRVLILVHRVELLRQVQAALDLSGAGASAQVLTVQSAIRRLRFSRPDLIIIDEAHHASSQSWLKIIAAYPSAKILGVTATPQRLDGRGLGGIFDSMILGPSVQSLIDEGFLARPVYYAPPTGPDLGGVHRVAGDFNRSELASAIDTPKITGSAVNHYTRLCPGKPALVFCVSLKHCADVAAEFKAAGYRAECIDGKLNPAIRRERTLGLSSGAIQVLVSCELINEGYDCPAVTAAILLRPTESLGLHLQQIGRALRPAAGKPTSFILDHAGNCLRHGLAEEPREWTLDPAKPSRSRGGELRNRQCPACFGIHAPAPRCPYCQHVYETLFREVPQVAGELVELSAEQIAGLRSRQQVGMARDRQALMAIAAKRGYKPGWVNYILSSRAKSRTRNPISEGVTIASMRGVPEPSDLSL